MAANDFLSEGPAYTIAAPAAANGGIGPISGDPLIWGLANSPSQCQALVAQASYTPPGGVVPTGNIPVKKAGGFFLRVEAKTGINGASKAINIGDKIYADGGTQDVPTGILYGITLNANNGTGWPFGRAMAAVAAGQTATIPVEING
jgi:hypothetical protein